MEGVHARARDQGARIEVGGGAGSREQCSSGKSFICTTCPFIDVIDVMPQVGSQVEKLKQSIADLRKAEQAAKDKQKTADDECKRLQRDMDEFKNNKEGKIDELKVNAGMPLSTRSFADINLVGCHFEAERRSPEACSHCEDTAQGSSNGYTGVG